MTKPLEGRLALVTGASRGIGAATAEALAAQGAHVILTARTATDLEMIEDRIHQAGGTATIAPLDLLEPEAIGRLAIAISERWQRLDIMVLNAAMLGTLTPLNHANAAEFAKVFTLNVSAQQALIAAFDSLLRKSELAQIIGLTSSVATQPRAFWGAYGASKAAFENLLQAYAAENLTQGRIRVAIVDPLRTRTQMRAKAYPGEDPSTLKPPSVIGEHITQLCVKGFETGHKEIINQTL